MIVKTDVVRNLVKEQNFEKALRIAGKFKKQIGMTKEQLNQIQLGYSCLNNSDFYKQLGKNTEEEITKAYKVLEEVYGVSASNSKMEELA